MGFTYHLPHLFHYLGMQRSLVVLPVLYRLARHGNVIKFHIPVTLPHSPDYTLPLTDADGDEPLSERSFPIEIFMLLLLAGLALDGREQRYSVIGWCLDSGKLREGRHHIHEGAQMVAHTALPDDFRPGYDERHPHSAFLYGGLRPTTG